MNRLFRSIIGLGDRARRSRGTSKRARKTPEDVGRQRSSSILWLERVLDDSSHIGGILAVGPASLLRRVVRSSGGESETGARLRPLGADSDLASRTGLRPGSNSRDSLSTNGVCSSKGDIALRTHVSCVDITGAGSSLAHVNGPMGPEGCSQPKTSSYRESCTTCTEADLSGSPSGEASSRSLASTLVEAQNRRNAALEWNLQRSRSNVKTCEKSLSRLSHTR